MKGTKEGIEEEIDIDDPHLLDVVDEDQKEQLMDEIELLDGASAEFDQELVSKGELSRYSSDLRSPTLVWRLSCSTSSR